jgi:HAD superfamily phosphatase
MGSALKSEIQEELAYQPLYSALTLGSPSILLFDIDGVIRDVAGSYRMALQETVAHYSGWRPSAEEIDALKGEGLWNNDWDASLEFLRRRGGEPPDRNNLISVFSDFYFGGDPNGDPSQWKGFIGMSPCSWIQIFSPISVVKVGAGALSVERNRPLRASCSKSDWD